jgi:threonine/homoserine/homoserine lactone efflux protein
LSVALAILVLQPVVLGGYVLIASRARAFLRDPKTVKLVNRGSGTMMAAAAIAVATR